MGRQRPQPSINLSFPSPSSEAFSSKDAAEGSLLDERLQRVQAGCSVAIWPSSLVHWKQIGNMGQLQGSWGLCLLATVAFSATSLFRKPSVQEVCARARKHTCAVWSLWFGIFFVSHLFPSCWGVKRNERILWNWSLMILPSFPRSLKQLLSIMLQMA